MALECLKTVSCGEFIRAMETMLSNHPESAETWRKQIDWAKKYDPFTPICLWKDPAGGETFPKVELGSDKVEAKIKF